MKSIRTHRNFSKAALLLVATLTLQSCFVARDYVRPDLEIETEALYRTENLPSEVTSCPFGSDV